MRKEAKKLGFKLSIKTFSWGPHCVWTYINENKEEYTIGNIAPRWWGEKETNNLLALDELRKKWFVIRKELGEENLVNLNVK